VADLSIGAGVENKEHVISSLLLKLKIVPAIAIRIDTFHFKEAMNRFAILLGVSRARNLGSVFEESVIITH
jgi:hypothetical protein